MGIPLNIFDKTSRGKKRILNANMYFENGEKKENFETFISKLILKKLATNLKL